MFDNFSVPEAVWTIAAALGLLAGAYNIWISRDQLLAVLQRGLNNGRRIIALGRFARDVLRMIIQVLYFAAGWIAGQIPVNPDTSQSSSSIVWMLVATSVLVTVSTLTDTLERYATLHLGILDRRTTREADEDLRMGTERRAMEADREDD